MTHTRTHTHTYFWTTCWINTKYCTCDRTWQLKIIPKVSTKNSSRVTPKCIVFNEEQNCPNEDRYNSLYVSRKQKNTHGDVAQVTTFLKLYWFQLFIDTWLHFQPATNSQGKDSIIPVPQEWRYRLAGREEGGGWLSGGRGWRKSVTGESTSRERWKPHQEKKTFYEWKRLKTTWTGSLSNV